MAAWMYDGINFSIPGTGGSSCCDFLPATQRYVETFFAVFLAVCAIAFGPAITYPNCDYNNITSRERSITRLLLTCMSLVFGMEIGFKLATKTFLWTLNLCHVVTIVQIIILALPPCKLSSALFRGHLQAIHGAVIALLLPVVNTRELPGEVVVYYVQHILIILTPLILMRLEHGIFRPERVTDLSWFFFSGLGVLWIYHFGFLQYVGMVTEVNLANMVCPAVSDPFYGRYYRIFAMLHQSFVLFFFPKLYSFLGTLLLSPPLSSHSKLPINGVEDNCSSLSDVNRNIHFKKQ